jgi:hypothetical protein
MAIGEFGLDDMDFFTWLIFFFSSIIEVIVLLNLLIAIISESFAKIQSQSTVYTYRERAKTIRDFYYVT